MCGGFGCRLAGSHSFLGGLFNSQTVSAQKPLCALKCGEKATDCADDVDDNDDDDCFPSYHSSVPVYPQ